jgi:hypothetical protein
MRTGGWVRGAAMLFLLASSAVVVRADDAEPESTSTSENADSEGLVAHIGSVTASFRFFGDVGAGYDSSLSNTTGSKANFLAGSFDVFTSARLTDHLQMLSEIVAEFEPDTNEGSIEMERLWAAWSQHDAFYVKLGREHSPVSHWNRIYHHGRIFWPAVTQPFIARFEDSDGPLPIHQSGVEIGGNVRTKAGVFGYVAVVSNGRGLTSEEVTNVRDRDNTKAWDAGVSFSPSAVPGLQFGVNYHNDRIPADPADPLSAAMGEEISTLWGELRAGRWEAITEGVNIDHETEAGGPKYQHRSGYLQVNCAFGHVAPYARVDTRKMAQGDRFYIGDDLDLDRWDGLVGVRLDIGSQAAFKIEAGRGRTETRDDLGAVTKEGVTFAEIGLQWFF